MREPRELESFFSCGSAGPIAEAVIKRAAVLQSRSVGEGGGGAGAFIFSSPSPPPPPPPLPSPTSPRLSSVRDVVTARCLLERPAVYHWLCPSRLGKAGCCRSHYAARPPPHTHTQTHTYRRENELHLWGARRLLGCLLQLLLLHRLILNQLFFFFFSPLCSG